MQKQFKLTRKQAAQMLGVSTRTIDRYIRSGKLSYKKVANKVLCAYEEVAKLQKDFSMLHQQVSTEVINNKTPAASSTDLSSLENAVDQKLEKFFTFLSEKDKQVEDKNKIIFMLQQRIGELEGNLKNMIALPDYNKEKQSTLLEKAKLETKINELQFWFKKEKSRNSIFIGAMMIIIIAFLILSLQTP